MPLHNNCLLFFWVENSLRNICDPSWFKFLKLHVFAVCAFRGQPSGVHSFLLSRGSWGPNSGCRAWLQVPLPNEPSLRYMSWFLKEQLCMQGKQIIYLFLSLLFHVVVSFMFCCQGRRITLFYFLSFKPLYPIPHVSEFSLPNPTLLPPTKCSDSRHSPNMIAAFFFQLPMNVTCVFRHQEIKEATDTDVIS